MATITPPNLDTLITIKVAIDGTNRKFKLPLRDLGAQTLPEKLRHVLNISPSQDVVFERYSDSAASFITLDPTNPSVYKQLYRAAKAKLKLRLKATIVETPEAQPIKAEINDEPSPTADNPAPKPEPTAHFVDAPTRPAAPLAMPRFSSTELRELYDKLVTPGQSYRPSVRAAKVESSSNLTKVAPEAPQPTNKVESTSATHNPVETEATKKINSGPTPSREGFVAELARVTQARQAAIRRRYENGIKLPGALYSVFCNSCDASIPGAHYHCSICDDGDFDLCQKCIDTGVLCDGQGHWLIKRMVLDGRVINSTTETIAPRKADTTETTTVRADVSSDSQEKHQNSKRLTCNQCIEVYPENEFVSCTICDDFDLCISCHVKDTHGHHPGHQFKPASDDISLSSLAERLCNAGRGMPHFAICDGCEESINGVRHKCLDCPDFDFCNTCVQQASETHPRHRFAPIYEPISLPRTYNHKHEGISCDGPLCERRSLYFITGVRYKCAVCHDTDFCANCEASPLNKHNRTHPLIKLKTPVRNVSVSTMGENRSGEPMPTMGDLPLRTRSQATETKPAAVSTNAATQVQVHADLAKPASFDQRPMCCAIRALEKPATAQLDAEYESDTVADGTRMAPGEVFTQTWQLRNPGPATWPAGCSVKFVGGDNMRNVDSYHPSSVADLEKSIESNSTTDNILPNQLADFSVTLKAPTREGTCISYWRLTAPNGEKFGHKLWCDVNVSSGSKSVAKSENDGDKADTNEHSEEKSVTPVQEKGSADEIQKLVAGLAKEQDGFVELVEENAMIFPKLDKESPMASTHEAISQDTEQKAKDEEDYLEELAIESDDSEEGFLTDEEYDILDASDEELLEAQSTSK